jgi:hypothetical protein
MTISDVVCDLFTVFDVLRLAFYLPQIYKIARGTSGAWIISYSTWILWTVANSSTAIYVTNVGNVTPAWTNGLNALCCAIAITLTAFKQRQYHAQLGRAPKYPNAILRPTNRVTRSEWDEPLTCTSNYSP